MNIKYYIIGFLFVNGAELALANEYPAAYLSWLQQIRHIPGTDWLNQAHKSVINPPYLPNTVQPGFHYNNCQSINRLPISSRNYYNQLSHPPYQPNYLYRNPVQYYVRQPTPLRPIVQPYYTGIPQQRVIINQPLQRQYSYGYYPKTTITQPVYQRPLVTHQKPRPMMCIPIEPGAFSEKHEAYVTLHDDDDDEEEEEDYSSENEDEFGLKENTIKPKIKHYHDENVDKYSHQHEENQVDKYSHQHENNEDTHSHQHEESNVDTHSHKHEKNQVDTHSHQHEEKPVQKLEIHVAKSDHIPEKVNPKKKKRRRRRHRRGPRINKKIGRAFLKGLHAAEDVAASGALGPQMKAAAIAAKAAETAIGGMIRGESAAEIAKKTAMTAATASMGGGIKAQMMSQIAAQAGVPVPPEMANGGAPAGGGSLKQQMMNQAGQQALGMAMAEVAKHSNANQAAPIAAAPQT